MTKQEKQLLLVDLCARLPYGLKVQIDFGESCPKYGIDRYVDDTVICVYPETFEVGVYDEDQACDIEDVKLYLRPMSSMTEEEAIYYDTIYTTLKFYEKEDWLNKHLLDYRDLIPMGIALEAPEDMYK